MSQQRKQHLHLVAVLLDIAKVINHQYIIPRQLLQKLIQCQFLLGSQQFLHDQITRSEVDQFPLPCKLMTDPAKQMGLTATRLQAYLTAVVMNLKRLAAVLLCFLWLTG
jgi:hypothetical protein